MSENSNNISHLIIKYLQGILNDQEKKQLQQWKAASRRNQQLFKQLTGKPCLRKQLTQYHYFMAGGPAPTTHSRWSKIIAVPAWAKAALIIVIATGAGLVYYLQQKTPANAGGITPTVVNNTLPADTREAPPATINTTTHNSTRHLQTLPGNRNQRSLVPLYQTLSTNRGQTHTFTLPDGSVVFLNDSSSITYPVSFNDTERKVIITGEVYFVVAEVRNSKLPDSGSKVPFIVNVQSPQGGNFRVEVLGTQFNINAYGDAGYIKTTVVKGTVRVISNNFTEIVKEGKEAVCTPDGKMEVVASADTEATVSWKNQVQAFHNAPLKEVIPKIERRYKVQLTYTMGPDSKPIFNGKIPPNETIDNILSIIRTQCRIKIEQQPAK
jgi:ferric-dicitrate binding protein FerR (iron transport regulator)